MAIQKRFIHFKKFSDFNSKKLSANEANTQYTVGVSGVIQDGEPDVLYSSYCWIKDTQQQWTHGQLYDCSIADNVYITDFTVNDLENAIWSQSDVVADLTSLEEALAAHKVILVPYNADDGFLGHGVLVGYAEDLLYLSIYSGGYDSVFYEIEADRGATAIRSQNIFKKAWSNKQDNLVSGINIKTINGTSILGEGDFALATKSEVGDFTDVVYAQAIAGGGLVYALPDQATGDEDDILLSSNTVKTINGTSLLGSGNIEIESGEANVQSDWNVTDTLSDAYIKNKPTIPTKTSELTNDNNFLDKNTADGSYIASENFGEIDSIAHAKALDDGIKLYALPTSHTGDDDDIIATKNTLKTINGESIVGSGNIVISGGGSGAYSEVNHGTSDTTFTLTPNTFHVWDEVASLTLDFGSETSGVANEFLFQFTSGATATSLTLPDDIKWANDSAPIIEANMIYQVSVLKGLASVLSWENIKVITFMCADATYEAESNMTWQQFTVSDYNVQSWSVSSYNIFTGGGYLYYNGSRVQYDDIIIENGSYYIVQESGGA